MQFIAPKHPPVMEEAMQVRSTESNIVRPGWGAGNRIQIQVITTIRYQGRGCAVGRITACSPAGHHAVPLWRIKPGRLSHVPLSNIAIFRAGEEIEGVVLGHNALHGVLVTPERLRVGVSFSQCQPIRHAVNTHARSCCPRATCSC